MTSTGFNICAPCRRACFRTHADSPRTRPHMHCLGQAGGQRSMPGQNLTHGSRTTPWSCSKCTTTARCLGLLVNGSSLSMCLEHVCGGEDGGGAVAHVATPSPSKEGARVAWSVVRARRSHPACATGRGRVGRRAVRMREMAVRVRRPWGRTWRQEERRGRRWCRKGREGRWQHRAAPGERLRGVTVGELREEGRTRRSLVRRRLRWSSGGRLGRCGVVGCLLEQQPCHQPRQTKSLPSQP